MATSTVTLFYTDIVPEKNFLVEGITSYLNGLTPFATYNDYQYQRIELTKTLKFDMDQSKQANAEKLNYCRIVQDYKTYYYFIVGRSWKSTSTIEMNLVMDTINTYELGIDYTFNARTQVFREHKNRFKDSITPLDPSVLNYRRFVVDKTDEGLTGVATNVVRDQPIEDLEDKLVGNWYLVYVTENGQIKCYLYPKETINCIYYNSNTSPIDVPLSTLRVTNESYYWYSLHGDNAGVTMRLVDNSSSLVCAYDVGTTYTGKGEFRGCSAYYDSVADRLYTKWIFMQNDGTFFVETHYLVASTLSNAAFKFVGYNVSGRVLTAVNFTTDTDVVDNGVKVSYYAVGDKAALATIDSVNRTNSNITKIIECCYCPIDISFDANGYIVLPAGWNLKANAIYLNDISVELEHTVTYLQIPGMLSVFNPGANPAKLAKSIDREPKLFHSSISPLLLNYDSFDLDIKREHLVPTYDNATTSAKLNYKQANTITSNLAFKMEPFEDPLTGENYTFEPTEMYENFLIARRNNEYPIYTSEYLDYIKTGYNYDLKQAKRQNATNILGIGLNFGAGIGSTLISKSYFAAAGAISFANSTISGITNAINANITNMENIQRKKDELSVRSANVSGSDDLDLLNYYNGNKLRLVEYQPTTVMKNKLYDLFFYCGYATDKVGVPSTNSRYWFNYVQCDPIINDGMYGRIPNDFLDDIISRWNVGVTILHPHNNESDETEWNFAQNYENFEKGMIPV